MYFKVNDELGSLAATIDVAKAVKNNRIYMVSVGWQKYFDEIVSLLGFTTFTPNEEIFAQAIADWQEKRKLKPDGIIGSKTWAKMKVALGLKSVPKPSKPLPTKPSEDLTKAYKIKYETIPGKEYGGKWKSTKPPGLPNYARKASSKGEPLVHIERIAQEEGLGDIFVKAVLQMAKIESGGSKFALPANIFNALPKSDRKGKPLITAWGVFQFNRDAWRSLPGVAKNEFPWDSTAYEEIARPIKWWYAKRFRQVLSKGGSAIDGAGAIRIFHITPRLYGKWLKYAIANGNFQQAWAELNDIQIKDLNQRSSKARKTSKKQRLEKYLAKAKKNPLRQRIEKFLKAAKILSSNESLL
ncbi:MAG: peptidoglycan-binding protein [Okeania sp. SIO2C2]|uniref:peptidoglycan-binding domain-containing protein n=1 Tax=Okeania sp. SIO2C2 TaxID=2607787 RepID=UPI0013BD3578|nr:peptidoglycan-binding domain-containing protein [Okeania sp. SIO2C2]NEP86157.1 peptidoglycan-binding protein [Okeania sp. SIO2C2]